MSSFLKSVFLGIAGSLQARVDTAMSGHFGSQLSDGLPRVGLMAEEAHFTRRLSLIGQNMASFGGPVIAGTIVSCLFLAGAALSPFAYLWLLAVAVGMLVAGCLLFLFSLAKRRKASRLYRTGAFQRVAAVYTIAASQKYFLIAQAILWGGFAFLGGSLLLAALGATLLSYILAGGLISAGCGHFIGSLRAKSSVFGLICCKTELLPKASLASTARYALQPEVRLAMDMAADVGELGSLLAIIAQEDARADGVVLRIPDFGEWPGLSFTREFKVRMKGSLAPLAFGGISGLLVGSVMLVVLGLPSHTIPDNQDLLSVFSSAQRTGDQNGASQNESDKALLTLQGKQGDSLTSGAFGGEGQITDQYRGLTQGPSSLSPNAENAARVSARGVELEGNADGLLSSQMDQPPIDQSGQMPDLNTADSKAQDSAQAGDGPSDGSTVGGGGAQAAPQGLSNSPVAFPDASLARDQIEIEALGQNSSAADSVRDRTGNADDGQEYRSRAGKSSPGSNSAGAGKGAAQSSAVEEKLPFSERGTKAVKVEEIHAAQANRETNRASRPHIPVQQVPHWMRSLLKPQSQ